MSISSGYFQALTTPDLIKEQWSSVQTIVAGAGVAQIHNPPAPMQGVTVLNSSQNWVRGITTFAPGLSGVTPAAQRTFLVAPMGSYSFDLQDEDAASEAAGAVDGIGSISIVPVVLPVVAGIVESSTLAVAAAATAGYIACNFTSD
jgi:hypothetical protein